MRLALISLDQRWQDKDANFLRCADFVQRSKTQGCELVIFPEMTLTGYSLDIPAIAEPETNSPTLKRFGELSKKHGISILFGVCLIHAESKRPRNYLCLARPNGDSQVLYSKIHVFSFAGEDKVIEAGDTPHIAQVGDLHIGCSVCYDLRFPDLFSAMAPQSNAVVNIASWPAPRVAHWRALLVARAIENQLFVFGVNRTGSDGNGLSYEKSSMAIAPDGSLLKPISTEPEMEVYDIDPTEAEKYRKNFHTLTDKRYSLYQKFFQGPYVTTK